MTPTHCAKCGQALVIHYGGKCPPQKLGLSSKDFTLLQKLLSEANEEQLTKIEELASDTIGVDIKVTP